MEASRQVLCRNDGNRIRGKGFILLCVCVWRRAASLESSSTECRHTWNNDDNLNLHRQAEQHLQHHHPFSCQLHGRNYIYTLFFTCESKRLLCRLYNSEFDVDLLKKTGRLVGVNSCVGRSGSGHAGCDRNSEKHCLSSGEPECLVWAFLTEMTQPSWHR